ncbi:hypothetical protein ABZ565_03680 [Streptomyces sp. NPDC016469]|uniref:hypothetical protein n=1 Tax=Streptomyces sp. NPDC016469 TaxID=3157191 RepID=UPI0033DE9169
MTATLQEPPITKQPRRVDGRVFRITATVHTVLAYGQPAFAGVYLSGDIGGLNWHAGGADAVFSLGLLQAVVAGFAARRMRRWWPFAVSMLLLAAESVQYLAGMKGLLWLHIPLGVMLIAGLTVLAAALWVRPLPERVVPSAGELDD